MDSPLLLACSCTSYDWPGKDVFTPFNSTPKCMYFVLEPGNKGEGGEPGTRLGLLLLT